MTLSTSGLLRNPIFNGGAPWVFGGDAGAVTFPYAGYSPGWATGARLSALDSSLGSVGQTFIVPPGRAGSYMLSTFVVGNPAWLSGGYVGVDVSVDGVRADHNFFGYDLPAVGGSIQGTFVQAPDFGGPVGLLGVYLGEGSHRVRVAVTPDSARTHPQAAIFYWWLDWVGPLHEEGYRIPGTAGPFIVRLTLVPGRGVARCSIRPGSRQRLTINV